MFIKDDMYCFNFLLGLKSTSSSTGWHSLAEAQFKVHRYLDSATSCSQGKFFLLVITIILITYCSILFYF